MATQELRSVEEFTLAGPDGAVYGPLHVEWLARSGCGSRCRRGAASIAESYNDGEDVVVEVRLPTLDELPARPGPRLARRRLAGTRSSASCLANPLTPRTAVLGWAWGRRVKGSLVSGPAPGAAGSRSSPSARPADPRLRPPPLPAPGRASLSVRAPVRGRRRDRQPALRA